MSEPTPTTPPTPLTAKELECWAVAAVLETAHPEDESVVGPLKHAGTRALRGMPFTFRWQEVTESDNAGAMIIHGMIAGVTLMGSGKERIVLLHTNLVAGDGQMAVIAHKTEDTTESGWFLSDGNDLSDQEMAGTLEIG